MNIRRRKSRKAQAADMLGTYLKVKAAGKAAKGAKKTVAQVAKRTPVKRLPLIVAGAGAAAAAFVAIKARGGGEPASA